MELTDGISSQLMTQSVCSIHHSSLWIYKKEPLVLIPTATQMLPLLTEGVASTYQQCP